MWNKKLRKLFLSLFVVFVFLLPVSLQAESSANTDTQNQPISLSNFLATDTTSQEDSMNSSNSDSKNLKSSEDKSQSSNQLSANAAELLNNQNQLLDDLEKQWMSLEQQLQLVNSQVKTLESQSESLKQDNLELKRLLMSSNETIKSLKENLENYKTALQSNKNDTSYIVGLFAEAQTELDNIKKYVAKLEKDKKHLRNVRITSIVFTGVGVGTVILANVIPITDNNVKTFLNGLGYGLAGAGGITLVVSFIF